MKSTKQNIAEYNNVIQLHPEWSNILGHDIYSLENILGNLAVAGKQ